VFKSQAGLSKDEVRAKRRVAEAEQKQDLCRRGARATPAKTFSSQRVSPTSLTQRLSRA